MFFSLLPAKAILSDSNEELVNCYKVLRDDLDNLIGALKKYKNDEEVYYKVRQQNPNKLSVVKRAARFIFLNKTCYNGLYRVNKEGKFNVPFGSRKNPTICEEVKLLNAHRALQGVNLICDNYVSVVKKHAEEGDFVFFDPPYYPVGGFSDFKRYTKELFYEEDHIELRDLVSELVGRGVYVLLTNSNAEFVRKLYDNFQYKAVKTRRNISCNAATRTGQDLIVIATKPQKKTPSYFSLQGKQILEKFPGTRFMGSKYRVLPFIWDCVKDLPFDTVIDAFSGSACVSYMFKQQKKKVISNDFMSFCGQLSKALIQNSKVVLDKKDVEILLSYNLKNNKFISTTFKGLYFSDEENQFLDSMRSRIEQLGNEYKRALALSALNRACLKRRARGIFTYVGHKYDDGRRDMKIDLRQHFLENVEAFNHAVFNNGFKNESFTGDIFKLDVKADLVYIDPPYCSKSSDNDYTRRYHFIEGLTRQWEGLKIQLHTKTKKFEKYNTPFSSKDTIFSAFDSLFQKFQDSILVVSYSSNSIPSKSQMINLLKKYKDEVIVHQVEHLYSFGTHGHKVGDNANRVLEYVFVAY
ncbi:MAG: Dam family site-specific DNA-(adenine-N6)-methyltransferase [Candidatus Omnitrophota bacterium]